MADQSSITDILYGPLSPARSKSSTERKGRVRGGEEKGEGG